MADSSTGMSDYIPAAWQPYIARALQHAVYKPLGDGTVFGEIPDFDGLWANAPSRDACIVELAEVLYDWAVFRLEKGLEIPAVPGISTPSLAAA